jgi:hypothetical protein
MLGKVLQSKAEPLQITDAEQSESCIKPPQTTTRDALAIDVQHQPESPVESAPIEPALDDDATGQSVAPVINSISLVVEQLGNNTLETDRGPDLVRFTSTVNDATSDIDGIHRDHHGSGKLASTSSCE